MVEFSTTLADALAPITLISGVGLLLVSMSARYGHATTRIRQLMAERSDSPDEVDEELENSIRLIYRRAKLLKKRRTDRCAFCSFQQSAGSFHYD